MQALYDKEETLFRHMNRMRQKEEELGRRAKQAMMEASGGRGYYVPRARPEDFDDWPVFKQKAWLLEEEKRMRACTPYAVEEKPADFDDWPFLKKQMWLAQQYYAKKALVSQVKTVSYFRGIVKGFSELAVSWTWMFGDTAEAFEVYISGPEDDPSEPPSRLFETVPAIANETQYHAPKHLPTVTDLDGDTDYRFGIRVKMRDMDGEPQKDLPITTAGHQMTARTARYPQAKLRAEAKGFSEVDVSFDWEPADKKVEAAVAESVTLYRTGNYEPPGTEPRQLADEENPHLDSAIRKMDESTVQYGPFSMFPLWKPAEVTFAFAIEVKMRLPTHAHGKAFPGRVAESHRTLPLQIAEAKTLPEPEFDYIHAKPLSFSDMAIEWGWTTTEQTAKFVIFRTEGRAPGSGSGEVPSILVDEVAAIPVDDDETWRLRGAPVVSSGKDLAPDGPRVMHYRGFVVPGLWDAEHDEQREYTFGVVVHMANGLALDMRTVVQTTAPRPRVDYFSGEPLSCSAISLEWGWAERRRLPAIPWTEGAEQFVLCRSEDGIERDKVEMSRAKPPTTGMASVGINPPVEDYPDYVVTGLGPQGLCSLSDGMKYTFSIEVKMTNGLSLPLETCDAWTAPRTFMDWSAEEVALWVRLEVGYPQYADTFVENDVSGAVAAVLSGEDLELDLGIVKWSPRMAILLAIKVMVENSKQFGNAAIGYSSANVDRAQRRNGSVWDAVRSVDGGPLWWRFSTEVVWGPELPTFLGKPWHEEELSAASLTEPAAFNLPASTFELRSHPDLRARTLQMRDTFFAREQAGGPVKWDKVDPPPRAAAVDERQPLEELDDSAIWTPSRWRRRGQDGAGPCLAAALEAGVYEAPDGDESPVVSPALRPGERLRNGALMPHARLSGRPSMQLSSRRTASSDAASSEASDAERPVGAAAARTVSPPSEPPDERPVSPARRVSSPSRVSPHRSRPFKDWSAAEVSSWVRLVLCLPEHADAFLENDVGGELAMMLEAEELQDDLGITKPADRLKILTAIGKAALQPAAPRRQPSRTVSPQSPARLEPQSRELEDDGAADRWLASTHGQSWVTEPSDSGETGGADDVQASLQLGAHRPQSGPIAGVLRAANLGTRRGGAASAAADDPQGLLAGPPTTDAKWWKFVGTVTGEAEPEPEPEGKLTLPWEVDDDAQAAAAPAKRKPKEWERLLDTASIREVRMAPDGAGGLDAEDAWSPSVGRKGHRSGAMAAVARSIQPNTPSPR